MVVDCRINTTEPNQMILVFFSEDNVLFDEIKICYIFENQSNENLSIPLFLGNPVFLSMAWSLTE